MAAIKDGSVAEADIETEDQDGNRILVTLRRQPFGIDPRSMPLRLPPEKGEDG